MLIVVKFALGASLDLLGHLGNKLVNAHLNGLVGAIADENVAGLDLLLAQVRCPHGVFKVAGTLGVIISSAILVVESETGALSQS